MIGRSGERWSGISQLAARHDDDDDDDDIYIYSSFELFYNSDGVKKTRRYNVKQNNITQIDAGEKKIP